MIKEKASFLKRSIFGIGRKVGGKVSKIPDKIGTIK